MSDLVRKSGVQESTEMNVSTEFYGELEEQVQELIEDAERRAEENGRKTVMPRDL